MVNILIYFLMILEVIVALVLIGLILIQRSKAGGGLGGLVGGSATEEVFGAGGTNVVVKATVTCAVIFLGTTLGLTVLQGWAHNDVSDLEKKLSAVSTVAPASATLPPLPGVPSGSAVPLPVPAVPATTATPAATLPPPTPAPAAPAAVPAPAPAAPVEAPKP